MAKPKKYATEEDAYKAQLEASRAWKERNRDHTRAYARNLYRGKCTTFEGYCEHFLARCKRFTKDTDVDLEFLLALPQQCAVTGRSFEYDNKYGTFSNPLAPSLDQINPSEGYYKRNIQVVLNCINKMKNDMPDEAFRKLWKELTWRAF